METGDGATRLLLCRHPETVANREHRFIGVGESPYSDLGRLQAEALAVSIAAWRPDIVRSSPRTRAHDVAVAAAEALGVPVVLDADLAEIDFGEAEGLTYDEADANGVPMDFLGGPAESAPFGGGETWGAFAARVRRATAAATAVPGRVAVVTHSGVVRAMLVALLGLPEDAAWRFAIPTATMAEVTVVEDVATLRAFGLEPGSAPWERPSDPGV